MAHLTLVLGGVRSGKSRLAEQFAVASPPVVYLATAQVGDDGMASRILDHQSRRAAFGWRTVEEPWYVPGMVRYLLTTGNGCPKPCVLLECLSLWLTNLMLGVPGRRPLSDHGLAVGIKGLIDSAKYGPGRLVIVSNEVGFGLMPPNALARRFGDRLGEANQQMAAAADEVFACIAGLPLRLK